MVGLVIAALAPALVAGAVPPQEQLQGARLCLDEGDTTCAREALARARDGLDELAPAQRIEVLELSAVVALKRDEVPAAEGFIAALVEADPGFIPAPARWPRAWREVFDRVRAKLPDETPPHLEVSPPIAPQAGAEAGFVVRSRDPSRVVKVTLVVGERRFELRRMDDMWVGAVPGELVRAPALVVAVEAVDGRGNVARWGGEELPGGIAVAGAPPAPSAEVTPVYETWWFWTIIGVAVTGTAIGLGVGLSDTGPPPAASGHVAWPE